MDSTALVTAAEFNLLPRNPLSPSGQIPNHWHFSVRFIPRAPTSHVLFIVNPTARYSHVEGPLPLSLITAPLMIKARVWTKALLRAFQSEQLHRLRPWTWSTDDPVMAIEVGIVMGLWGVQDGLDRVGIAGLEESAIADEEWARFLTQLETGLGGV